MKKRIRRDKSASEHSSPCHPCYYPCPFKSTGQTGFCSGCGQKNKNSVEQNNPLKIPQVSRKQYYAQNYATINKAPAPLQNQSMPMMSSSSQRNKMKLVGNLEAKMLPSNLINKKIQANTFSNSNSSMMRTANNSFNQVSRSQESEVGGSPTTTDTENLGNGALINYIQLLEKQYAQACAQPPAKNDCCCCTPGQSSSAPAPVSSPNGGASSSNGANTNLGRVAGRLVIMENGVPVSFVEEELPEYVPGYNPNPGGPAYNEYVPGLGWTMKNL